MKKMLKSKTFWSSVAFIAISAGGVYTGQIPIDTAVQNIGGAVIAICGRHAVAKLEGDGK